ncbi:MAG: DUF72 domain-containing protein [Candidatus Dormiibacterota bacterium]
MPEVVPGRARIGISGWTYPSWRGVFYPRGLVHRLELQYAAEQFPTVECNGSFYATLRPATYERWHAGTGDDFVFAVKGPRFVTHLKRLREVEVPLANFFASGVLGLREKLGPLLWQLPPNLAFDASLLERFFTLLPPSTAAAAALAKQHDERVAGHTLTETDADRPLRHALEVRHESFMAAECLDLCRRHGVALVVADTAGRWPLVAEPTAGFVYVRLHGEHELYSGGYSDPALDRWAASVRGWADGGRDVYVYFDNDIDAHAPLDARRLLGRLG